MTNISLLDNYPNQQGRPLRRDAVPILVTTETRKRLTALLMQTLPGVTVSQFIDRCIDAAEAEAKRKADGISLVEYATAEVTRMREEMWNQVPENDGEFLDD
jgi:hypothetical protein